MNERIIIVAPGEGVAVGGRFDGWRMRQHPDGQWISVARLEAVDPFAKAEGVLGMLFAEHRAKSEDTTLTPAPDVPGLLERLRDASDDPYFQMTPGVEEWLKKNWALREQAADALEALQAEVEGATRVADVNLEQFRWAMRQMDAWQTRATAAEAERDALKAEVERKDKALREAGEAIAEYFRYLNGGETRGSYDGKPEREGLRKAGYAVSRALAPAKAGG